ncbi:conserved hypothetical protein [Ricinus communis]|uniref:Uncharacterized protein n=1 Tax=Ricinus communis TaxID=3988 RepID=B9S6J6_RICCO|nr:conserved hypothetical protein [Ricinus communis]
MAILNGYMWKSLNELDLGDFNVTTTAVSGDSLWCHDMQWNYIFGVMAWCLWNRKGGYWCYLN